MYYNPGQMSLGLFSRPFSHSWYWTGTTIGDKIVDTFTLLTPYFVTVIPFFPPSLSFHPPSPPQTMLCGNCCDLEWGSGVFSTVYCAVKRVVLFGAPKVLLRDNVSTNYVADCSLQWRVMQGNIITKRWMSFVVEKAPRISLSYKLFPVQYGEYENDLFHNEGVVRVCGDAVLHYFWCGFAESLF